MWPSLITNMLKKGSLLLMLPFFNPTQILAEPRDSIFSRLLYRMNLPIPAEEEILTFQNKHLFYATSSNMLKRQKKIAVLNLNHPRKKSTLHLTSVPLSAYDISAIGVSEKKVVLISFDSIFFYERTKNVATLISSRANARGYSEIGFTENNHTMVLHKLYNYHPNDQKVCCEYLYLDAAQLLELQVDTLPYKAIAYSHQVHNWQLFPPQESFSYLALSTKNGLVKLNRYGNFDTLYLPSKGKSFVPDSLFNLNYRGKQMITHLLKKDQYYNRIEKIFQYQDTLIISEIYPGSGKDYRLLTYCYLKDGVYTFKEFIYKNGTNPTLQQANLSYSYPMFFYNGQLLVVAERQSKRLLRKNKFIHSLYYYAFQPS